MEMPSVPGGDLTIRRAAVLVATMSSFLTPFMVSTVNIALPAIGEEFAMGAVPLGWVATAYSLAAAMCLLPAGRLADIHGRKRIFAYGLSLITAFSCLCALAPSASWLIGFRVIQGIGASMVFGTGIAILSSVFPAGQRGQALGFNTMAVYVGLSVGPLVGGYLTQHFGWRSVFLVNGPLGAITVATVVWILKGEWAGARGEAFDLGGSTVYGLSLVAIMYGFSRLPSLLGLGLVGLGALGTVAFVRWEMRRRSPVLDVALFRNNPVFAFSNLAALINYSATSAVAFLLSLYLQVIKALSPSQAGMVLVAQPIVQAVFSPLSGRWSDRIEPRVIASCGMGLTVLGLVSLSLLGAATPLAFIVGSLILLGLGFALFSSPNTNAVMGAVERRWYGVASSTLATMRLVGNMLSMGITMLVFSVFIGQVQITPEHHALFLSSARTIFAIFALLCLGGVFASLARGKVH